MYTPEPRPGFDADLPFAKAWPIPSAWYLDPEVLAAALSVDDVGEPGELVWFPDRTYGGRTYVPGTAQTSTGIERTVTSETFTNLAKAKAEGEAWSKSNISGQCFRITSVSSSLNSVGTLRL